MNRIPKYVNVSYLVVVCCWLSNVASNQSESFLFRFVVRFLRHTRNNNIIRERKNKHNTKYVSTTFTMGHGIFVVGWR